MSDTKANRGTASKAKAIQFLDAKPRDEARAIWHRALRLDPLPAEAVPLGAVRGRVLAEDVRSPIDVPPFDRSMVDGYAVIAADTYGHGAGRPAVLRLLPDPILAGVEPRSEVVSGTAVEIATGGVVPRGANAIQMVERTDLDGDSVLIDKAVVPGQYIQAAGSDLRAGEVVLVRGTVITSRETGVLASIGVTEVPCVRRPRVAVFSTGDELVAPGAKLRPGLIYDANSRVVADAIAENGGEPTFLGIVPDDEVALAAALREAASFDAVVLSGGTSKGTGDLSFRLIDEVGKPGVLVHGVQVKPGKPIVLAAWAGRPVVVLPGFPTSAILTFNLFMRPVLRLLAGLVAEEPSATLVARVTQRLHSEPGRYEYRLVSLVQAADGGFIAHPIPKGSGSISGFAEADGYLEIPEGRDLVLEGETATVTLLARSLRPADLVFVGSHCRGMEILFDLLRSRHGLVTKILNVGSAGGVAAIRRGEADIAGVHLLDGDGRYNRAAWAEAGPEILLVRGYGRRQGIIYRTADHTRPPTLASLIATGSRLINRPRGAGTRVLLDHLLDDLVASGRVAADVRARLLGYDVETNSHNAAAAAVAGGRADWALGIEAAALPYGLGFVPLRDEDYDLLVPAAKCVRPAIRALLDELRSEPFRLALAAAAGFRTDVGCGDVLLPAEANLDDGEERG